MKRILLTFSIIVAGFFPHQAHSSSVIDSVTGFLERTCTVENWDRYAVRALAAGVAIATMYGAVKGVQISINNGTKQNPQIFSGYAKKWTGSLPIKLQEIVNQASFAGLFLQHGVPLHNGYLLYGVPGTGKTWLARVLSDTLQIPLLETNSGQFINPLQGSGNIALKTLLQQAHSCWKKKPFKCIVFIDEIDGLTRQRGSGEEDRLFNELLSVITKPENSDILFLGATNFIDKMDAALKRDGRLVPIELKLPTDDIRKQLVQDFLARHKLSLDRHFITLDYIGSETGEFSLATLAAVLDSALRSHLQYDVFENPDIHNQRALITLKNSFGAPTKQWFKGWGSAPYTNVTYSPSFSKALKEEIKKKKESLSLNAICLKARE